MTQWLGLWVSSAGVLGFIPGQGIKIPHDTAWPNTQTNKTVNIRIHRLKMSTAFLVESGFKLFLQFALAQYPEHPHGHTWGGSRSRHKKQSGSPTRLYNKTNPDI